MNYFVYMLKSISTGRHYYGHTNDLKYRLNEHSTGQSPHTKGKGPWKLIGYLKCNSRSEAMKIENKLKKMKNPSRAKNWLLKMIEVFCVYFSSVVQNLCQPISV